MAEYKTPGVYIEEISTFPASVVRVATAVPIFVGYTELAGPGANIPVKIRSLVEYEALFGGEPSRTGRTITVTVDINGKPTAVSYALSFHLYNSLRLFYANGGGDAYICSVGVYGTLDKALLTAPFAANGPLETCDEPTLILVPDAYALASAGDLGDVQKAVLAHCNKMQDRFGIFDVKHGASVLASATDFRGAIGTQYLKYGAAYYPELNTSIGPNGPIPGNGFVLQGSQTTLAGLATASGEAVLTSYAKAAADKVALPSDAALALAMGTFPTASTPATKGEMTTRLTRVKSVIDILYACIAVAPTNAAAAAYITSIAAALKTKTQLMLDYDHGYTVVGGATALIGITSPAYVAFAGPVVTYTAPGVPVSFYAGQTTPAGASVGAFPAFKILFDEVNLLLKGYLDVLSAELDDDIYTNSKAMATIRDAIRATGYIMPPSGAIAGIYAAVDASRGVWKAPANVSLNAVTSVRKMASDELDNYNVDTTGKSINAIRYFRGQGNLVYGARTLAGNDNEWRYVPVRRLFIMVEESVKKATEAMVFEPNDANTWQRAKGMVENFLITLWRDGALAGAVPKDAFFVKVGLGQTMTAQDILEGRLIIEIGMAAVRPAEFIILKFSHKMQES